MDATLSNVKRLLKTGGVLILKEATQKTAASAMTFGLLEGWWVFEDPENRLPGSPLISPENWRDLLGGQGFEKISTVSDHASGHLILARSDGDIDDEREKVFVLSAKNEERLQAYGLDWIEFLKKEESVSLSDLAYTSQIGREAMAYRLAILADSPAALASGLRNCFENKENKHVYIGNTDKRQKSGRTAEQDSIERAIKERKLSELARLWASGSDVPWRLLYTHPPNVISMPTYPFARDRYWIVEPSKERTDIPKEKKPGRRAVVAEQSAPPVLSGSSPF